jgi:hypothetical protein
MLSDQGTQPPAVSWTPAKLRSLHLAWQQAEEDQLDFFVFEGHRLATGYARWLIIYLEGAFK